MKTHLTKLTFVWLLLFMLHSANAANYYFSSANGDDSRTPAQAQNPATPWRSIDKLNSIMPILRAGDVVYLERGREYVGTINFNASGTPTSPIRIAAYGSGPAPIVTSLTQVTGWRSVGNGVFESNQTFNIQELNLVLINGQQAEQGRYPNRNQFNGGFVDIISNSGNSSVTSSQLGGAPNFTGGEVVIRKNQWIIDRHTISNHAGASVFYSGQSIYSPSTNFGFFIQNHINTLDQMGEWFFNKNNRKLYVYFGSSSPNNFTVQIPTRNNLLVKNYGSSNFQIENVHFKGSNEDAISLAGGRNVTLLNNTVEFSGRNGMQILSILELKVNGNTVNYSNNNGIFLRYGNNGAQVLNNRVTNTATFQGTMNSGDGAGIAIYTPGENSKIQYNEITNTGYSGIYFGGNNTEVSYNYIDTFCLHKGDGGGIYSYGTFAASRGNEKKVTHNIILNGEGGLAGAKIVVVGKVGEAHGIFLDDNASNVIVSNNTIASISDSGIKLANVNNIKLENNTIYDVQKSLAIGSSSTGGDVRNLDIQRNIFFPKEPRQLSYYFLSQHNDIGQIGNFANNFFFKPFGDPFHIYVRYANGNTNVEHSLDLNRWRQRFNKDHGTRETTVNFERFSVINGIGNALFGNGRFQSNINGVFCNSCQSSWVSGLLNPGALRVQSNSPSTLVIPLGAVKKDGSYVVKFSARANKSGNIRAFLRHSGSPWQVVSASSAVQLSTSNQEYALLLRPFENIENAALVIVSDETSFEYRVEDLDIRESNLRETTPDQRIVFEYNKSKSDKRVALNGSYVDGRGQSYSGSVTIAPYQSLVLFKTSADIPPAEVSAPTIQVTSPVTSTTINQGENLTINTSVSANGNAIKEVSFVVNGNEIGRAATAPYNFTWENPTAGDLSIKAIIHTNNGLAFESQMVNARLALNTGIETNPDNTAPVEGTPLTEGIYINTGSTRDGSYKGILFTSEFNDRHFQGGNVESNVRASGESMMQSQRFGRRIQYNIPVPNGKYEVKTYHNEVYFGVTVPIKNEGLRVFDIAIEGVRLRENIDPIAMFPNGDGELVFDNIEVRDGMLNLDLTASVGDAIISGIAIIPAKSSAIPPVVESELNEGAKAILQINTGSTRDAAYQGSTFISEYRNMIFENGNIEANVRASAEPMLQSQRFGPQLRYRVNVPNGTYTVRTYHNEVYFGRTVSLNGPGLRVFDIRLQGQTVKSNMDLFVESNNRPLVLTFENVVVRNGVLSLELEASMGNAAISGFAVFAHDQTGSSVAARNETAAIKQLPGVFINAGSTNSVIHNGLSFSSDFQPRYFNGGNIESSVNASPQSLLQSHRFGRSLSYNIPVPNGSYTVISYHNEVFFGNLNGRNQPGLRVFDVNIQGRTLRSALDMYLENNGNSFELVFENVRVTNGILTFQLLSSAGDAAISGLAVIPSESASMLGGANLRQETANIQQIEMVANPLPGSTEKRVSVYPNPTSSELNIRLGTYSESILLHIHNSAGNTVVSKEIAKENTDLGYLTLDVSGFKAGIYFLTIQYENGRMEKEKFVVK